jgi:hypothetical protein
MQEVQQSVQVVNATVDLLLASAQDASGALQGAVAGKSLTWPLDTVSSRLESLKAMLSQELGDMGQAFPGGRRGHVPCLACAHVLCRLGEGTGSGLPVHWTSPHAARSTCC